ncbi:E2 domain-associated cysteine-rich protein [Herbaspirillum autotrophicum]|uniref:E2 domain-associated cysteine-rich protein n=1 Tax=Herbaspirillum autotrophicum TaxID=180195 RepID=UPI00067B7DE6|nr:E2 domain-associated cysteine-rich protein [Herbaspirillum autotrophicum]
MNTKAIHPLALIEALATEFFSAAKARTADSMDLHIDVTAPSGHSVPFDLELTLEPNQTVKAKEIVPAQLPEFCPERHINFDGSFCLFVPDEAIRVVDEETARAWFETLWNFLKAQIKAEKKRVWPDDNAWAHGLAAAHQRKVEQAVKSLGPKFETAYSRRQIAFDEKKGKKHGNILRLIIKEKVVFSVFVNRRRVINHNQRCFCDSMGNKKRRRLRGCSDHAQQGVDLVMGLRDWKIAEEKFWESFKDRLCCNTCDVCPLKSKVEAI